MAEAVVLASGNGTNFQAIAERAADSPHVITALICDRDGVPVLERARGLGIRSVVIDYRAGRQAAETRLAELLKHLDPDLVFLAGFMKILPATIVDAFRRRIINIHPALLPSYPGLRAIERAISAGETVFGVTVHYVDAGVDTGEVIEQRSISRVPGETFSRIEERIHELEHQLYPDVALQLLDSVSSPNVSGAIL